MLSNSRVQRTNPLFGLRRKIGFAADAQKSLNARGGALSTLIDERVAAARASSNPTVIGQMASGWVVIGDSQFLAGYCLLLADPVASSLNDLNVSARSQFLLDMAAIGDGLLAVTAAYRVNYEILGNTDPALHAHIFPRYRTEPAERMSGPVWLYGRDLFASTPFDLERDRPLMRALYDWLHDAAAVSQPGPMLGVGV